MNEPQGGTTDHNFNSPMSVITSLQKEFEEASEEFDKIEKATSEEVEALRVKWVEAECAREKALKPLRRRCEEISDSIWALTNIKRERETVCELYEAAAFEEPCASGGYTKLEHTFITWRFKPHWRDPVTHRAGFWSADPSHGTSPPATVLRCLVFDPMAALQIVWDTNLNAEQKYTKLMGMFDAFLGTQ
jgi:hypothetical protein